MASLHSALVTGATGMIGSVLVERLLEEGVQVFAVVRAGGQARMKPASALNVIETSFGRDELRRCLEGISCDVVFHLASYGVQSHERDSDQLIEGNVRLLSHLLPAVGAWPLERFIFSGSCSEYGFPERENMPMSEGQPLRPTSLYGAAKAAAELYGNALAGQLKIPFVTLRIFNVFGPGEGPHRLLPAILQALEQDRPVELTGGEQQRDLLYVEDVADSLLAAAGCGRLEPLTAYNVCSGLPVRIRQVGEIAADLLGKSTSLLGWGKRPYRSDEPMWVVGNPARFREATSWRPKLSLAAGIERMIAARRKSKNREHRHAV